MASPILLRQALYPHAVLFFGLHAPGKQPGGVRLVYPNDHDANFCQACGTSTGAPVTPVVQPVQPSIVVS